MPDKSMRWGDFFYPGILFEDSNAPRPEVSPTAVFDPIAATEGNPFTGATSPFVEPKSKVLLVVANLLSYDQRLGLLAFLGNKGFRILLLCASPDKAGDPLVVSWSECSSDEKLNYLKRLAPEDEIDFPKLAKDFGIARDSVAVLNSDNFREIMLYLAAFLPGSQRGFQACGNHNNENWTYLYKQAAQGSDFMWEPSESWPDLIRFFQYYAQFNHRPDSDFVTMLSRKDYEGIYKYLLDNIGGVSISPYYSFVMFSLPEEWRLKACEVLVGQLGCHFNDPKSYQLLAMPLIFLMCQHFFGHVFMRLCKPSHNLLVTNNH